MEKLLQSWFLTPRPYGYSGNALMMLLIFPFFFLQLLSSYHILSHSATTCKPLPGMFECVDNQVKGRSKPLSRWLHFIYIPHHSIADLSCALYFFFFF